MFTNINITGNDSQYKYIIEYCPDNLLRNKSQLKYLSQKSSDNIYSNDISFWNNNIDYLYHKNYWIRPEGKLTNQYLPNSYNAKKIKIYFPQHSVETYVTGVNYALTLSMWINGKIIILGSFIINPLNLLACNNVKIFMNQQYYEYIEFEIPDPREIMYSDKWKKFRKNVCGKSTPLNNTGSILYISLHPVNLVNIDGIDAYIKIDDYTGGQNSLNLLSAQQGDMRLELTTNVTRSLNRYDEEPSFILKLLFNNFYGNDLKKYLTETYNIDNIKLKYNLIIGNEDNLYATLESPLIDDFSSQYIFTKSDILKNLLINQFKSLEGINVVGSIDIIYEDNDINDKSMYLLSNKLPITPSIFRYFNTNNNESDFYDRYGYYINNVNLNDINMNLYNVTPINKIEQTIVHVDKPSDAKSNLIKPIFFRTTQISDIVIHPEVTEIICLNLDKYKSVVKTFMIQIEGMKFTEIGKNKYGVLFKIEGKKLPKKISEGTYYILNEDSEVITYGKFNYE